MACRIIFFILLLIGCISMNDNDRYLFSNYYLDPYFVILNSTSISKFLCTKQNGDDQDFEISTVPNISSDDLRIYENRFNDTAMEITIDSSGYIGAFYLICSATENRSIGIRSDVYIGTSPGPFTHIEPCIVYENQYIDCIIHAPIMISAMNNRYPFDFSFTEIHPSLSRDKAYKQPPKIVKTDDGNKTITFRWWPVNKGIFPSNLTMLINGTLRYFGSTNLTIDMTPSFSIKSNFTVEVISSNYFQVHFNHNAFSFPLFCRGNVTIDEKNRNQEDDSRIFRETNPTSIDITHLASSTWYKICFQCRGNTPVNTISEIQCLRKQTKHSFHWLIYLIFGILILSVIIGIIKSAKSESENCIKKGIKNCRISRKNVNHDIENRVTELLPLNLGLSEQINLFSPQITADDYTRETINS